MRTLQRSVAEPRAVNAGLAEDILCAHWIFKFRITSKANPTLSDEPKPSTADNQHTLPARKHHAPAQDKRSAEGVSELERTV